MTTLAWDGTTLAADRAAWSSGNKYRVRKLSRVTAPDGRRFLVGVCGDGSYAGQLLRWMRGAIPHPGPYPEPGNFTVALVIDERRRVFRLGSSLQYTEILERFHACGAGQDYAIGALEAGATARQAVQIAIKRSDYAGLGVDTVRF